MDRKGSKDRAGGQMERELGITWYLKCRAWHRVGLSKYLLSDRMGDSEMSNFGVPGMALLVKQAILVGKGDLHFQERPN